MVSGGALEPALLQGGLPDPVNAWLAACLATPGTPRRLMFLLRPPSPDHAAARPMPTSRCPGLGSANGVSP